MATLLTRQISNLVPTLRLVSAGAASLTQHDIPQLSSGRAGQRACAHLGFSSLLRYSSRSTSSSSRGATSLENVSTMEHPTGRPPRALVAALFSAPVLAVRGARSQHLAECDNRLQAAQQVGLLGALPSS